jgi:hypothetical protein
MAQLLRRQGSRAMLKFCWESPQVAKISKSQVQAAVSAIIEREQREGMVSPILHINESNRVWIRRNLRKHLEPVLSKMGLEKDKIQERVTRHQDEVRKHLEKHESKTAKRLSALTKSYEKAWANRQAAIKHLAAAPFVSAPLILDKPSSIFVYPSGMLAEDHIASGNSWAKIIWTDSQDVEGKDASVRFFFAWTNPFDYIVVTNVSADLIVRGQCTVSAFPGLLFGGSTSLFLTTQLKVHLSGVAIGGHDQEQKITSFGADTWGSLFGGDKESRTEDVFSTAKLSCQQVLVDVHQLVIIEVSMIASYWIDNGSVTLIFARDHPYVACPAVMIETLAPPT